MFFLVSYENIFSHSSVGTRKEIFGFSSTRSNLLFKHVQKEALSFVSFAQADHSHTNECGSISHMFESMTNVTLNERTQTRSLLNNRPLISTLKYISAAISESEHSVQGQTACWNAAWGSLI